MASQVIETATDLHETADEMFAADRLQAVVAVRVAGGSLGYGNVDLELLQAVVDTANARGFSCSQLEPAGEFAWLLFDPDTSGTTESDDTAETEYAES
jgi:hypothetical protein